MTDELASYFSGEKLYGDDFTMEEIDKWFSDEAEGYANLGSKDKDHYSYGYHQLNRYHGYRFLAGRHFDNALGIGSAYGDEFRPVAKSISKLTILDPSEAFADTKEILGVSCSYQKPNPSGDMSFDSSYYDLIVSLGVMHHIPNVSHVLGECNRCLRKGGIMLLREPITSMGDWRKPRSGLTKRERGIPLHLMDQIVRKAGFTVLHRSLCVFSPIPKLSNKFGVAAYNNFALTVADSILSQAFSWNIKYHRTNYFEKVAPSSVYYVLTK
ncbi:MAG: class I SAM-dependent methyltransferase [Gammaproteobacteria bacterium]|nr:class I SAM-dependent methyltransferase [Gammaproteobacteria bacterium]